MKCPKCGEKLEDGAAFCTNCGEKLTSAPVCPHCGAELRKIAKFCDQCGAVVITEPDATTDSSLMNQMDSSQTRSSQQMETDISAFEYEEDDEGVVLTGLKDKSLTQIVIPDSVTEIGYFAFSGCSNLESVVIPDSVTKIRTSAFANCSSLESVVIPDSVTEIGCYAFRNCTRLKSVVIPDSVTEISDDAFSGCTSLDNVVISPSFMGRDRKPFDAHTHIIRRNEVSKDTRKTETFTQDDTKGWFCDRCGNLINENPCPICGKIL